MNLKKIKSRLYEEHACFIICGSTHTGKSILLNYLIPEKYILHAECDIKVGKKSILLLDDMIDFPVIGIDEVSYVDDDSLIDCIRKARNKKIGMVIVCQTLNDTRNNLQDLIFEAITINTNYIDLRETMELNWIPRLKLVK